MKKTVGGVSYDLVREADTTSYNCLANCVYQKEGKTGGPGGPVELFCFAAGDFEVVCSDGHPTDLPPG